MKKKVKEEMSKPILEVVDINKKFPIYGSLKIFGPKSYVNAASDVSFKLYEGETYGLVGESGSGKTTTGRIILGLTKADSGKVIYNDRNLLGMSRNEFRQYRKDIQLVFQDPFSSLNPRKRIGDILEEPLIIHNMGNKLERQEKVFKILEIVGLQPEHYFRFPHEFSGGQRQRLGLARALIINPKIVVCDEPVSALDVSIQAQILNLLKELQEEMKLTLLFITHDISVVRHVSNRIGIMYLGKIVEEASTDDLFKNQYHPYTLGLFSAVPDFTKKNKREKAKISGEIPKLTRDFQGCVFYNRCPMAQDKCRIEAPLMEEKADGHFVACHFVDNFKEK